MLIGKAPNGLTIGEELRLCRLRLNLTQVEASEKLNVAFLNYRNLEARGQIKYYGHLVLSEKLLGKYAKLGAVVNDDTITDAEVCVTTRRYYRLQQIDVANAMGLCRYTIIKMEKGKIPCDALITFWSNYCG